LILWRKVMNSLLLMVVLKCLMVWISVCRNMTTSFIFPLFASFFFIPFCRRITFAWRLSFWLFYFYKAIILWLPWFIKFYIKYTFTTLLIEIAPLAKWSLRLPYIFLSVGSPFIEEGGKMP
jgi:hypothetical protein